MKYADLTPPLGSPGGPCHLIQRIRREVRDPRSVQRLIQEVEQGQSLNNPEASKIYDLDQESVGAGPFHHLLIGPHAQYRMDLRGVQVSDLQTALGNFGRLFAESQARGGSEFRFWSQALMTDDPVKWTDPRSNLTVVFTNPSPGKLKLVTTYWRGREDPKVAPGSCRLAGTPVGDLTGWKTVLDREDTDRAPRDQKDQSLPSPPWGKSKDPGRVRFNGPPSSEDALDEKPLHSDRTRTLAKPGEDSPHPNPEPRTTPTRRQDMAASIEGPTFPGSNRQKKQYGEAKNYARRYYRKNRVKVHQRMKRWYKKHKKDPRYKRDKQRRQKNPERFNRYPGGYSTNAERARDQREKKASWSFDIPVWYLPGEEPAQIVGVSEDGDVNLFLEDHNVTLGLEELFDTVVFEDEDEMEDFFHFLDKVFDFSEDEGVGCSEEDEDERLLDERYFGQTLKSAWTLERETPDVDPEQRFNRGSEPWTQTQDHEHEPLEGFEPYNHEVRDNPGSSKVIPQNKDFVNNRSAARFSDIQSGCDPSLMSLSSGLTPVLKRVDNQNLVWAFDVQGSKGPYRVRIKATASKNALSLSKMDIKVSCSCPYWRWQGPEHWAKMGGYLFGTPVGTASKPVIKDPKETHRACKHVLAVFAKMQDYSISPRKKVGSTASSRVARRYLEAVLLDRELTDAHL